MKFDLLPPKDKAEDLLNKMTTTSSKLSDYSMIYSPTAKYHVYILIDELIKYSNADEKYIVMGKYMTLKQYWKEVLNELEKF